MKTNEVIKSVCRIFLVLVLILISYLAMGFYGLMLPLSTFIVVYPLFALAKINKKLDLIAQNITAMSTNNAKNSLLETTEGLASESQQITLTQELVDYINAIYGVSLKISDELSVIKEKIMAIPQNNLQVNMFKSKVLLSRNIGEVATVFETYIQTEGLG